MSEANNEMSHSGEKIRSNELLAGSEADGHGKNRIEHKRDSDVGQCRRHSDCKNGCWFPENLGWEACQLDCVFAGGERSYGVAERLANVKGEE